MNKPLPRLFTAVMVAVLLLCSAVVAFTLFHHAAVTEQITQVQANLDAVRGRLRKQQAEYAQYQEELPLILAQLEAVQPDAQAAYDQEQALRQQRKELRAENSALADELAALLVQANEASADAQLTADAITSLQEALNALEDLAALYQ